MTVNNNLAVNRARIVSNGPVCEKFVVIQLLGESSSGYLVGDSATLADVGLLEFLLAVFDYFEADVMQDYPHLRVCLLLFKSK
jgi:Glutathione S-transferase, C-terminal domain